ncbi:MAG: type III-A CRISPR-associated RAMP protein Csm3 [Saprospiraceae bacterium]
MSKKLTAKIFITGRIVAETGLHIGGSKSSLDIGGVDLNIIKTPHGQPFIPGSSLKGKLRSMLARVEGSYDVKEDKPYMLQLFGSSGDEDAATSHVTRLIVRDALLDTAHFQEVFENKDADLDFPYSYVKWENTIERRTGTAKHPRQLERVPAGAEFDFELVYDVYTNEDGESDTLPNKHQQAIETAMDLLQSDYIGGQGSRGYGKISFKKVTVIERPINAETGTYEPARPATSWQSIAQKFQ